MTPPVGSENAYKVFLSCWKWDFAEPFYLLNQDDCPLMVDSFVHFIPEQAHYIHADDIPFTSFGMSEAYNYNLPIEMDFL